MFVPLKVTCEAAGRILQFPEKHKREIMGGRPWAKKSTWNHRARHITRNLDVHFFQISFKISESMEGNWLHMKSARVLRKCQFMACKIFTSLDRECFQDFVLSLIEKSTAYIRVHIFWGHLSLLFFPLQVLHSSKNNACPCKNSCV